MIARKTVFCLSLSQLINWGISYYIIGAFGEIITADLGWTPEVVYGGFSAALVAMGLISGAVGRIVDRFGGRSVMITGSALIAAGCAGLALAHSVFTYYLAWLCLGVAMRLTLYDAAFATLARMAGADARRAISQITLLGGLASTVFWPIGHVLAETWDWRTALLVYAAIALLQVPLLLPLSNRRHEPRPSATEGAAAKIAGRDNAAAALYTLIMTLAGFLSAGMSSHMVAIMTGLGVVAATAVWISTLRGIGQSAARLAEVLFGHRISALTLNLMACAILPVCFIAGLSSGAVAAGALAFAFFYGAGNGILTITRGALPLVLFDPGFYGARVGRMVAPGFFLSAGAPVIYAAVIARFGEAAALYLSAALALAMLAAAIALRQVFTATASAATR